MLGLSTLPGAAQTTTTAPVSTAQTSSTSTTAPATTATTAPETTVAQATTSATSGSQTTGAPPTSAAASSTTASPATAREQVKVEEAQTAKAREVDAANAKLSDLTDALAALQSEVAAQAAEVEIANARVAAAEAFAVAAEEDVAALEAEVVELEYGLSDQAIRSFKGEVIEDGVLAVGTDPNQALRMQAMLAKATQSDIDYVNTLAGVREDLAARKVEAQDAVDLAEESQKTSEEQLQKLQNDRLAQGELASAAEQRLDHLLSERAALARLGANLDAGLDGSETQALVAQLAKAPAPAPSSSSGSSSSSVSRSDIRSAGKGIEVHVDIVDDVRRLLADAAAAGVDLAGGGYRDSAGQIATRRNNCGTSNYAIYEMPSSQCRPPTARPGRSQHELGKAIDFTNNGQLIRSRSGSGWNWLKAHAADYGLYNLPSEPWHWSVNGR